MSADRKDYRKKINLFADMLFIMKYFYGIGLAVSQKGKVIIDYMNALEKLKFEFKKSDSGVCKK